MASSFTETQVVQAVWQTLRLEASQAASREELLKPLLSKTIFAHTSFREALTQELAAKLHDATTSAEHWLQILRAAFPVDNVETSSLEYAAVVDLLAIKERDPACDSLLTAFLYFKGYKALQIHRIAHALWIAQRRQLALLLQSRCSEVFSVDIHPAAQIGLGLMIDHATGIVIGETAVVGRNCSFLHGVTLGSTGKESGNRHPKLGDYVVVGCNASILGNIPIGSNSKIGANAVVIKPVPNGATAVGSPARILPSARPAPSAEAPPQPQTPTPTLKSSNGCAVSIKGMLCRLWCNHSQEQLSISLVS